MSGMRCIAEPFVRASECIQENIIKNEASLVGRAVKWLRAPDSTACTKTVRKTVAIFLAVALAATVVGLIPLALGIKAWKVQEARATAGSQTARFGHNRLNVLKGKTGSTQSVSDADVTLEQLAKMQFSTVAPDVLLKRQADVQVVNPKHGTVALDTLQKSGLLPDKKLQVGNVCYYISHVFKVDKHDLLIALVEIEGKLYPRVFYHSNSQATWRVMPFASKMLADFQDPPAPNAVRKLIHYGKGQCETDTQLPIALIIALNSLPTKQAKETAYPAEKIVKTENMFDPHISFNQQVGIEEAMFLKEGAKNWFYNTGRHVPRPPNPHEIHMPQEKGLHPDFSQQYETACHVAHYGHVKVRVFASHDKSVLYMFHEAKDGRLFLASCEKVTDAPINSYGVRSKIIEASNMDAPLLEYYFQVAPGYEATGPDAGRYETDSHLYVSNWNYVRELEIIKAYYTAFGKPVPKAL